MAKAKKKAAHKPARKTAKTKTIAKRKAAPSRARSTKRSVKKSSRVPSGVQLGVSAELDTRLRELATHMNKSLEEVLIQALTEFADNWEDHLRTVRTLNAGDDRMQLSVPDDDGQS
ncbi:MAG: hypothetical protein AB7E79_03125 [Rhodospirillaceae bacterium]